MIKLIEPRRKELQLQPLKIGSQLLANPLSSWDLGLLINLESFQLNYANDPKISYSIL